MKSQIYMLTEEDIKVLSKQITENLKNDWPSTENQQEDVFLTIGEACTLIFLAKPTVYGLVHRNKIPYHKQGKRLYFLKSELLEWIKGGKRQTKSSIEEKANEYLFKNQFN
ncbi:helix-turn-helix domain-containing protein [Flavobacteriaceae bacterium KMM 6898]|nr:helix-turn-helix domain-containing protein [Flavobacteriaceae bacterium KMM 6898]